MIARFLAVLLTTLLAGAGESFAGNASSHPEKKNFLNDLFTGAAFFPERAEAFRKMEPMLQDGDLIFIQIHNPVFNQIAETCGSWESHVGIVFRDKDGDWQVAESTVPVSRFISLKRLLMVPWHGRFMIRRLKGGLSDDQKVRLRQASEVRMGKWYQTGFNYDSKHHLYCSKLVHDVYRDAVGEEVGKVQTFREILSANPDAPVGFWKAWFFGSIPWDRRCVTPTSELRDADFITVFDSEGPEASSGIPPKRAHRGAAH